MQDIAALFVCKTQAISKLERAYKRILEERIEIFSRRPPFVWLHIHKAGGELICTLAKWVREQVVQPSKLCNAYDACPFGDGTLGIITADRNVRVAMSQRPSCQKRMSYMTSHGFTFSSVERDLTIDEVSCGFVTGVMLREPVARMVSDPVTMHNNPVSNKFGTPTQRK